MVLDDSIVSLLSSSFTVDIVSNVVVATSGMVDLATPTAVVATSFLAGALIVMAGITFVVLNCALVVVLTDNLVNATTDLVILVGCTSVGRVIVSVLVIVEVVVFVGLS